MNRTLLPLATLSLALVLALGACRQEAPAAPAADAAPVALYSGTRPQGAFERTASRLIEMQSAEYLATPHKA